LEVLGSNPSDPTTTNMGQLRVAPVHANYFLEVTGKAPNQLFLFTGIIVLLARAVLIPVAFLYKSKS